MAHHRLLKFHMRIQPMKTKLFTFLTLVYLCAFLGACDELYNMHTQLHQHLKAHVQTYQSYQDISDA